ncbi:hypothetical protein QVD17_26931 [Tagetes erecta]|uniref:Uncharacterized protein n=1 Tax=Tagetes erecta TaxID=13708 RepID=A0AAD8NQS2_TARER|nr:hypothetical protein QVD17_26931 [Tagetes erecta]
MCRSHRVQSRSKTSVEVHILTYTQSPFQSLPILSLSLSFFFNLHSSQSSISSIADGRSNQRCLVPLAVIHSYLHLQSLSAVFANSSCTPLESCFIFCHASVSISFFFLFL